MKRCDKDDLKHEMWQWYYIVIMLAKPKEEEKK